jgi:excinuclease UvrABC nuclease subunit
LRFAPLVKLHLENEYPRASITTRLGRLHGKSLYYGPFPSRTAAEKFANDSLDFFKMRRCVDDLHPDPAFPGCIYSEMKMCLAPCFKGCSDEDYSEEVNRGRAYLDSSGRSLERELSHQRDDASNSLDFENAAALHARIEKLQPVLAQLPELVQRIDRLAGVIVQRSSEENCVALFRIDGGCIAGRAVFSISPPEHTKSQSMESRVQLALDGIAHPPAASALERWSIWLSCDAGITAAPEPEKSSSPTRRILCPCGESFAAFPASIEEKLRRSRTLRAEPCPVSHTFNSEGP